MSKILFITWDGPQTSYMEGLFMPIFEEISKNGNYQFHVLQFTWAGRDKIAATKKFAEKMGIVYSALPVIRKPTLSVGSLLTVFTSSGKIKKYIQENNIDIVMPRSTFPAMMINRIRNKKFKLVFDADGLPIEERIDFSGLKRDSFQYKILKSAESKILKSADAVITRSQKAIDIHIKSIGEQYKEKFSVVFNGRDKNVFNFNDTLRIDARKDLGIEKDTTLFVYAGSLGPQYCFSEMLQIFQNYGKTKKTKFLILTGNVEFAKHNLSDSLQKDVYIKSVPADKVSFYLNAGDIAFGLRQPTFSMQGVAPIKLGEYLLCGLPVIASKGIGDTEEILKNFEDCFLYDHSIGLETQKTPINNFVEKSIFADKNIISEKAKQFFSIEAAAESYQFVFNKI